MSGGEMARALQVSRNTIWKAVKSLQEEGYAIRAVTNRGYCLEENNVRISREEILSYLHSHAFRLEVCESADSTNSLLKKRAQAGEPEGLVLIAQEQTGGRGRNGRAFFSPKDSGIYMCILLRPSLEFSKAVYLTTCAAAAVAEVLDEFTEEETRIKWVNDIFCRNRKAAGILTEAAVDMEDGKLEYAVLGIGINVFPPAEGWPEDIRESAGAVLDTVDGAWGVRNRIIARILERFWAYYQELPGTGYAESYRRKSMVLGKEILVQKGKETYRGTAVGLDEEYHREVEREAGSREFLSSAEEHILGIDGT